VTGIEPIQNTKQKLDTPFFLNYFITTLVFIMQIKSSYDVIIVGAGIAGLLTALRLAQCDMTVLVIDKERIGNGSTLSNHGMIHSGALYVKQHEHVVGNLQKTQMAFSLLLSEAELPCKPSVYLAPEGEIEDFTRLLSKYSFNHKEVEITDIPELRSQMLRDYKSVLIRERTFSSMRILELLTSFCLAENVDFLLHTPITNLLIKDKTVQGVQTAIGNQILTKCVILANGLGIPHLLQTFASEYSQTIKSRLDIMVYLPKTKLKRGIIFSHLDKPVVMPTESNAALGSYYGGVQPEIRNERKFAVDFDKARLLIEMINSYFSSDHINTQQAKFWMCGKVDFIGDDRAEQGYVNPGHKVINHDDRDSISGLQSIITGKMSLAFHASKEAAENVIGKRLKLEVNANDKKTVPKEMMSVAPWHEI
jgi:glycerol-3-phosphate dehydrogenase